MDPNQQPQSVQQKKLPSWLTTVTPFSKLLAMFLFILLPFVGFYLGMQYQEKTTVNPPVMEVMPTITPAITQNPNSLWKTYTDKAVGFSIDYPSNWVAKKDKADSSGQDIYLFQSKDYKSVDNGPTTDVITGERLSIVSEKNKNFSSYEAYKNFTLQYNSTASTKEIILDTSKCLFDTFGSSSAQCSTFYNGRTYIFSFDSKNNQVSLFNQILSTFKFIAK